MTAQRTRMEAVSTNLANVHSTRTEEGGPFVKKEVVFATSDVPSGAGGVPSGASFGSALQSKMEGVKVQEVVESEKPFQQVYDPFHPDADANGYVMLPNVNSMEEMADMTAATRAYEANVNVAGSVKQMFTKALEIGQ
jgi:flagellar basal-body rod protein FlgC